LLDIQFSYSKFGQLTFKILEIIEFKQGASNTIGQGRNRATTSCVSAQRTPPNAGCPRRPRPLAARRSPLPEADRIPRLRAYQGRPRPTTHRGPHRATHRRTERTVPAGRAPFEPAVRPRPPARVRRATAVIHVTVTSRPGQPLFKHYHFPLCAPSEPPPSIAAAAGELAAPLAPAAGQPSHSLP
jgi:hypothetical protein